MSISAGCRSIQAPSNIRSPNTQNAVYNWKQKRSKARQKITRIFNDWADVETPHEPGAESSHLTPDEAHFEPFPPHDLTKYEDNET
jgi:hypothetical protein